LERGRPQLARHDFCPTYLQHDPATVNHVKWFSRFFVEV